MITRPVVLVLGAGASWPYGFPLGQDLFDLALVPDSEKPKMRITLRQAGYPYTDVANFQRELRGSDYNSVDMFLEHAPGHQRVGKAVMAYHIMSCEREIRLYNPPHEDDHWYKYLYTQLMHTPSFDEFADNELSIITYNYDRSLEFYLWKALQYGYQKSSAEARDMLLANIPIVYVHGNVGDLMGRPYEPDINLEDLKSADELISVVSENAEGHEPYRKARELIRHADHIVFLGFGYNAANVRRLQLAATADHATINGTVYGFTDSEFRYNVQTRFEDLCPST